MTIGSSYLSLPYCSFILGCPWSTTYGIPWAIHRTFAFKHGAKQAAGVALAWVYATSQQADSCRGKADFIQANGGDGELVSNSPSFRCHRGAWGPEVCADWMWCSTAVAHKRSWILTLVWTWYSTLTREYMIHATHQHMQYETMVDSFYGH